MSWRNHGVTGSEPDAATVELLQAVYRYAVSLCANVADAEDLVQESWLRSRERYGEAVDRKIVFRIVRNLYIDRRRREARFCSIELDTTGGSGSQLVDDDATRDPVRSCGEGELGRCLVRLRDIEREALLLSVVEGYSASEISALTGRSRGSVLSLVHRAKAKLHEALNQGSNAPVGASQASLRLVSNNRNNQKNGRAKK